MTPPSHGTRYEIAINGRPLTYRDVKAVAIETAKSVKARNPNAEVTVRDLDADTVIVIEDETR